MSDFKEYKPNKSAFVYYPMLRNTLGVLLLMSCIYLASFVAAFSVFSVLLGVGILSGLGLGWGLFVRLRVYAKTSLFILSDRIIAKGGGVIADFEKELLLQNVTYLNVSLPFFEHKLYRTGTVNVQAAGGSDVEIQFPSFDNPIGIYAEIEQRMRENGFSLSSQIRARQDRPHQLLVLLKSISSLLVSQVIVLLWLVDNIVEVTGHSILEQHIAVYLLLLIGEFLVLAFALVPLGADLNRRYTLYDDRGEAEVEFFFYQRTVIPIEKLIGFRSQPRCS